MNYRDYKIFAPNSFHHVYNRGNGKMDIFHEDSDFRNFIKRLEIILGSPQRASLCCTKMPFVGHSLRITPLPPNSFTIISHCLMSNHFHFLIRQNSEIPISKLIGKLCASYSRYYNKKYNHVGGLFQDQFKSVLIDSNQYLLWLSAYIHQNPVVAGLSQNCEDYPYSSYNSYLGQRDNITDPTFVLEMLKNDPESYQKFVLQSLDKIKQRKDLPDLLLD